MLIWRPDSLQTPESDLLVSPSPRKPRCHGRGFLIVQPLGANAGAGASAPPAAVGALYTLGVARELQPLRVCNSNVQLMVSQHHHSDAEQPAPQLPRCGAFSCASASA